MVQINSLTSSSSEDDKEPISIVAGDVKPSSSASFMAINQPTIIRETGESSSSAVVAVGNIVRTDHDLANHVDDQFLALAASDDLLTFAMEEEISSIADASFADYLQLQEILLVSSGSASSAVGTGTTNNAKEFAIETPIFRPLKIKEVEVEVLNSPPLSTPVDKKGKKPIVATECTICTEYKPLSRLFWVERCRHSYCDDCIGKYVKSKMEENITRLKCPDPECVTGFLDPEACRGVIKEEVYERWGMSLCESLIEGAAKFYCPFKDCSGLLIDEGQEAVIEAECPYCHRMFCAKCREPWHSEMECEEYQKLQREERAAEDRMLIDVAKNCKWQRCPKCKFFVEKIDGCMFTRCRCGYTFCYGCATQMTTDHYCATCRR